jgi:glutathione-specific gamma-glutamylcyclotransferase
MSRPFPPFELTRETILGDNIRALVQAVDPDIHVLTPEEHRASIAALLEQRPDSGDVWLFAYGSLIWNPLIHFVEKRVGTVKGYHRCFCLWTHLGRGTVETPGLMLGLEPGGSCRGVVYRIAGDLVAQELDIVWRREMMTGAYAPRWMRVGTKAGPVHALAFRINRTHTRYAGRLPEERVIATLAEAKGPLGACATYLFNTVAHLEELGIRDPRLVRLRDQVAARVAVAR